MKKTLICSALAVSSIIGISPANAELENSVSVGYAWSSLGKYNYSKTEKKFDAKGINLKFRNEIDQELGFITSFTYLTRKEKAEAQKNTDSVSASADYKYYSALAGASYRLNEWVSMYALAGVAYSKLKGEVKITKNGSEDKNSDSNKKTSPAGMLGVQFNPLPNVVVDASFEYSKTAFEKKKGIWAVGVGYRF